MVASEVDGFIGTNTSSNSSSTSTHIYCKPVKIKDAVKSRNIESSDFYSQNKSTSSDIDVSSSLVAIDVSGQTFSRMASFRRSLIHVDFLIRRKKKRDKRRNTVAEGDVKELKDAFEKIVTDDNQFMIPNGINKQILAESKNAYNSKLHENQQDDKSIIEQNNNADNVKATKHENYTNQIDSQTTYDEKANDTISKEILKKEHKLSDSEYMPKQLSSKRKPKSHIPISTISAAMNVAVELRQCNGIRKEEPVLNAICNGDHNSDSDTKLQEDKRYFNSSYTEDGLPNESYTSYRKRLQDKCRNLANRKVFNGSNLIIKEPEVSSSASSENIDPQDTAATTSTESDTFFISSDESDEDSSEVVYFQENCGSSTSIGTASDGSLNSLLSETGTEMTSSTGTLTSIGREHLLTSPPPPPPMIISASLNGTDLIEKLPDSSCFGYSAEAVKNKNNSKDENVSQKQIKHLKLLKSPKSDTVPSNKNSIHNHKNIFTSLVGLKTHTKIKNKNKKDTEKRKTCKNSHQPTFDMYGNNSPTKAKQIPTFIKENLSPVIRKQEKSHMKSFLVNDRSKSFIQLFDTEDFDKSKVNNISSKSSQNNNNQNISDIVKTRVNQAVSNIPPKYEHQVTVTPVQRCTDIEQKYIHHTGYISTENKKNCRHENAPKPDTINAKSQVHIPQIQKPNPPITLNQERSKLTARVVLDFDGKVIYTTNSLDRKNQPSNGVNTNRSEQHKSYDPYIKNRQVNNINYSLHQENNLQQNVEKYHISSYNSNTAYLENNSATYSPENVSFTDVTQYKSSDANYMKNDLYPIPHTYELEYPSSHLKSSRSHIAENLKTFVPKKTDSRPLSYAGSNSSDLYINNLSNNLLPNPNISGLPIQETMLTRYNVNLHSKQMEKIHLNISEDSFDGISNEFCVTPSSQICSRNLLNKSPQSTMSTEDLFAVIHNCKKRMNIKTDSDVSLASSSRSSSPSYIRPSSSKSTLAETGFLSPRSHAQLETSGDRRSWADFRPVDSICYERKSLASDRLGPTKPTSMHDFKMLLLQARTSSQTSGQRKSAVEMLKLPLNQNNRNSVVSLPLNLSPRGSISVSAQNSPTVELIHSVHNGHSTVPFKRGNRVRTSLQSRYIMYPPIFEDCSEDSEPSGDLISNKSSMHISAIENVSEKENPDCKQCK